MVRNVFVILLTSPRPAYQKSGSLVFVPFVFSTRGKLVSARASRMHRESKQPLDIPSRDATQYGVPRTVLSVEGAMGLGKLSRRRKHQQPS